MQLTGDNQRGVEDIAKLRTLCSALPSSILLDADSLVLSCSCLSLATISSNQCNLRVSYTACEYRLLVLSLKRLYLSLLCSSLISSFALYAYIPSSLAYSCIRFIICKAIACPRLFPRSLSSLNDCNMPLNSLLICFAFPLTISPISLKLVIQSKWKLGHSYCSWKSALIHSTFLSQFMQYLKSSRICAINCERLIELTGARTVLGTTSGEPWRLKAFLYGPTAIIPSLF